MPSTKEIKNRIESVRETRKITNAMYLIASAKLRRARGDLERTRAYFEALRSEIHQVFASAADQVDSRYFLHPEEERSAGACGALVITADKGMAGAYTQNVIKETKKLLQAHPDARLFVVGEFGRHYFERHEIPIEGDFLLPAQTPDMRLSRLVTARLLEEYDEGRLQEIYVVYTDQGGAMSSQVRTQRLLPFAREDFVPRRADGPQALYDFVPSLESVLEGVVPSYLSGFIYSALVSSYCCEQSERMNAMNTANQNAEKLLDELSLEYNRVRQAAITREITEVSAGAAAQRKAAQSTH